MRLGWPPRKVRREATPLPRGLQPRDPSVLAVSLSLCSQQQPMGHPRHNMSVHNCTFISALQALQGTVMERDLPWVKGPRAWLTPTALQLYQDQCWGRLCSVGPGGLPLIPVCLCLPELHLICPISPTSLYLYTAQTTSPAEPSKA